MASARRETETARRVPGAASRKGEGEPESVLCLKGFVFIWSKYWSFFCRVVWFEKCLFQLFGVFTLSLMGF